MSANAPEDVEAAVLIRVDHGPGHPGIHGDVTKVCIRGRSAI